MQSIVGFLELLFFSPAGTCTGADVGHPAPGSNHRPHITGMVATVDPNVSVMTSAAKVQEPRVEIIADLKDMMKVRLRP